MQQFDYDELDLELMDKIVFLTIKQLQVDDEVDVYDLQFEYQVAVDDDDLTDPQVVQVLHHNDMLDEVDDELRNILEEEVDDIQQYEQTLLEVQLEIEELEQQIL